MSKRPNNIERIRRDKKMSMQTLADILNSDPQNDINSAAGSIISKIEKGQIRLSDKWIRPIAKALNVTPNDLFASAKPNNILIF
ncbi:MAG: helix-turn-helix transcriptional regulator [Ahrensia sp.]|nr:helix-turn-helix transcriptional regulator [Ahrensia sp.]